MHDELCRVVTDETSAGGVVDIGEPGNSLASGVEVMLWSFLGKAGDVGIVVNDCTKDADGEEERKNERDEVSEVGIDAG